METINFDAARHRMLSQQLLDRGISDARVLEAMDRVRREQFIVAGQEAEAYADRALPIECGQTISQPYMVALMSEALQLSGHERVLEIGTGSGYQTAVLAELAGEVDSIERHGELSQRAAARLAACGYDNVNLHVGDGTLGWPDAAPFDRILVTAGAGDVPETLWSQLADNGLLVIPVGSEQVQQLERIRKRSDQRETEVLTGCRFVPLVGKHGWSEPGEN